MKVIIPAAGKGTRMAHLTKGSSKEMLLIAGIPMIGHIVKELEASGIRHIGIIIRKGKEDIKKYLTTHFRTTRFSFIMQKKPTGLGDALLLARQFTGNNTFGLVLPDGIFFSLIPAFLQIVNAHTKNTPFLSGLIRIDAHAGLGFSNAGRINISPQKPGYWQITKLYDKKPGYFRVPGKKKILKPFSRSIIHPRIFDVLLELKQNHTMGEFDDVPAWQKLAREGCLTGYLLNGTGFDVGNPVGYRQCKEFRKHHRRL